MVDEKINFKQTIEVVEIDLSEITINEFQSEIFTTMAERLSKFLNVSTGKLSEVITRAAMLSQKTMNIPFQLFHEALPQERLKLADDMKNEIIAFLGKYLISVDDEEKLDQIAEKMFVHYLNEFGAR